MTKKTIGIVIGILLTIVAVIILITKNSVPEENLAEEQITKGIENRGFTLLAKEDVLSYIAFPTQAEAFFDKREEKARNTFKYTIKEV